MSEQEVKLNWQQYMDEGTKLFERRRLAQAEVMFLEAMKIAEGFADNDPRLATSLNNLAALYHSQGKYAFAEDMYRRALVRNEKLCGEKSAEAARIFFNLAVLYSAKAAYDEAELNYKTSLAIKEELYGANDKELLANLRNYSELLRRMNRQTEAQSLEDRIKNIETTSN
jgi:tetratricopeptide (TPR) repeat protein